MNRRLALAEMTPRRGWAAALAIALVAMLRASGAAQATCGDYLMPGGSGHVLTHGAKHAPARKDSPSSPRGPNCSRPACRQAPYPPVAPHDRDALASKVRREPSVERHSPDKMRTNKWARFSFAPPSARAGHPLGLLRPPDAFAAS